MLRREHGETWSVSSQDMVSFRTDDEALRLEIFCFSPHDFPSFFFVFESLDPLCYLVRQLAATLKFHWSGPAVSSFIYQMKTHQTFNISIGTHLDPPFPTDLPFENYDPSAVIAGTGDRVRGSHIHTNLMISDHSPCVHR
jgi:hypothetical protein